MRIYQMTATFGKLEQQTLTLKPGLNVIHAPNEWGKSTWCAFLVAMLYGIDTRERTTQTALADKERYAPWSGSPMAGRIDLRWNGRDITVERSSKGRTPMGEFKAYETATGMAVPELTATNCGQTLLGVEKNVFTRAGFIRQTDLPVTEDEALRRRLNALVTTGDESGASDALAQKLKDLKNRCRHNKTGALPQAESQRDALQGKLDQLAHLRSRAETISSQQADLEKQLTLLENHQKALAFYASQADAERVTQAQAAWEQAQQHCDSLQAECDSLPDLQTAQEQILQLEQLRIQQEALQAETLPSTPEKPEVPSVFTGLSPEQAYLQAKNDTEAFSRLCKPSSPLLLILGCICAAAAVGLLFLNPIFAVLAVVPAILCLTLHLQKLKQQTREREALTARYPGLMPDQWIATAEAYRTAMAEYAQQTAIYQAKFDDLQLRKDQLTANIEQFTFGSSIADCLDGWRETLDTHNALARARQDAYQAKTHAETLAAVVKAAPAPDFEDTLTYTAQQTQQLQADTAAQLRQLQLQHGQCLGQMESLGQETAITKELADVTARIRRLEEIYAAVTLAQQALTEAAGELQRKFAPRISHRAQDLFSALTGDRYDRLTLREDLRLEAAARDEIPLRTDLWRSDGTSDQLYLALRLAVAGELTPEAPLILDDALVRFDDTRMGAALDILLQEAESKQILLFSCQQRENNYLADKV